MSKKVISRKQLPTRPFGILNYLYIWIVLDYFNTSDFWIGVIYSALVLLHVVTIVAFWNEKEVKISNKELSNE